MSDSDAMGMWAVVEVMGHKRYAGFVTEQTIAGCGFVQVLVPEAKGVREFTKLFGTGSIYAITPTTEDACRRLAGQIHEMPPDEVLRRTIPASQLSLGAAEHDESDDVDELDDYESCGADVDGHPCALDPGHSGPCEAVPF